MTNEELNKLQYYIGKRQQGQTDEQIIAHIENTNKQTPLTDEEWRKLFFPVCANADLTIFKFLLSKVSQIADVNELMIHTLRFRNPKYEQEQVEILRILFQFIGEQNRVDILNNALMYAAWFGEFEAAKFLIEAGADIKFVGSNGKSILESSQNAVEKFEDCRVHDYVTALL